MTATPTGYVTVVWDAKAKAGREDDLKAKNGAMQRPVSKQPQTACVGRNVASNLTTAVGPSASAKTNVTRATTHLPLAPRSSGTT